MKKLTLVFLLVLSATNVLALSETETNCDEMYASSDSVASVESAAPAASGSTSSSSSSATGQ
ncbi:MULTISPECIES: hypothetical protein [Halobacteriovorax]|uniref:Uncharacterized protein n=1 Tax=Halobacteriovorax vibrionivorans TaxID=2152716 RepID=A0ABY0IM73_9BACT|nr:MULTISPECIES: hypothetical protein [Halobacteriovorax]AYF43222.1 hypothetical protein BALOs_0201 [Halobacteriovorax sp. BALOs_7]RZF23238.1 hypothetical protein DAY19_05570 [Halobacteriovorax vibrionivorans]TGD46091.1 hypothetical protein EP118_13255 [Halobacteriovorax sp. Y22]